jgi:hypothetical protein
MSQCVITVTRESQATVTADCGAATVNIAQEIIKVYAGETGLQGKQGDPGIGGATWGGIGGTISNQADLQLELDGKANSLGSDDNYVTDAEKDVIGNTSNTNSGDQTSIVGITGTIAQFNTAITDETLSGSNTGDQDLSVKFDKSGGRDLEDFSEKRETLTFTAGAATLPVDTCDNSQTLTLIENSAITTSGVPVNNKPITLWVTHSGGAWTLSWNGTDLELEGASGDPETVLIVYNGANYIVNRGGVVDLSI